MIGTPSLTLELLWRLGYVKGRFAAGSSARVVNTTDSCSRGFPVRSGTSLSPDCKSFFLIEKGCDRKCAKQAGHHCPRPQVTFFLYQNTGVLPPVEIQTTQEGHPPPLSLHQAFLMLIPNFLEHFKIGIFEPFLGGLDTRDVIGARISDRRLELREFTPCFK